MGVSKKTPSFVAIRPHIKLFNIVRKEYDEKSTINREGSFSAYYLNNRWDYVNMTRDCVKSKNLLYNCKINPLQKGNVVDEGPFWFKIVQTRPDGTKLNPEEICDAFWKKLNKEGFSLYILGMTFQYIAYNINFCIQGEKKHAVPVKVTLGDVVLSCRKINKNKGRSWYGYKCLITLDTGNFKKSVSTKRPRKGSSKTTLVNNTPVKTNTVESSKKKNYSVTTIKLPVIKTMVFTEKSLPVTANFK